MNNKQNNILEDYFLHSALHMLTLEEQCLKKLCAGDLSIRELHVIEAVASLQSDNKNSMAEVAKYLHLSPASLTTAVNVLVRKEYIERHYSQSDKRVIYIKLTGKGEKVNSKYLDFVRGMIIKIGEKLDEVTADSVIEAIMGLDEYLTVTAEA